MAGAIDEDTARTIGRGRDAVGAVLSNAQARLKRVFIVFIIVLLGTIWALRAFIWPALKRDVLYARMAPNIVDETTVVAVTPFDVILLQVKIGVIFGAIVAAPLVIWYGRGALRDRGYWPSTEIPRWKLWGLLAIVPLLFVAGVYYAYELFFPLMFDFLATNAVNAGFTPTYSIVEWTEFIVFLMLSFGLAAQLPLAMSAMAATGIVSYETFRDKWRYAVLGIFVFGAFFSPPDPFTQVMWALPLIALYGVSLAITKLVVLSRRAGEHVPLKGLIRERWNLLAGVVVLVGGAAWIALTRGGLEVANELLRAVGSSYRAPTSETFSIFGLTPSASAAIVAVVVALFAGAGALLYVRIKALETVSIPDQPAPASAGEPAEMDVGALSAAGLRAAPLEAFAALSEEEAVGLAQTALDNDEPERAELILEKFDEAQAADLDDGEAGEDETDPVTSTAAGVMDAFTEEETTEEDIGGYYYDIAFILDSLTSRAIWLVGTFIVVMAATFVYLYGGGIGDLKALFLRKMPEALAADVDIVTLHPVEALIFEVKFSVLLGAVAIIPLVAYYAWPAMESRGVVTGDRNTLVVWGASLLVTLVGGSLLGFLYVAPAIIGWLAADALTSSMVIAYRINNFGWLVILTTVGIGLLAQLPVTMLLFHRGGIVSYDTMRRRWRVFVVGVFAIAGFATPKGVFTMFIVAIPASLAYAVGLGLLWIYTGITRTRTTRRGETAD
ncbi:MAG: twin-arginine translocase subunit TatC [Salinirussus sp.]